MNKRLIALAALATAGAASAQSTMTVFGTVDAGVSYYETTSKFQGTSATLQPDLKQSQTVLSNSGNASSRLGFRGQEDLGGGLAAAFWLESTLWNDVGSAGRGTLLFDRRATVSLVSRFGEVRMGRDYTPTFWNDAIFDPFGVVGSGTSLLAQTFGSAMPTVALNRGFYARKANSVGYFLPSDLGGFYGQAMYAFSENTKSPALEDNPATANLSRTGDYRGVRGGWANGKLDVAVAYGVSTVADNYHFGSTTDVHSANVGASYDFGWVKLFGEYSQVDVKTAFANQAAFAFTPALAPPRDVDTRNFLVGLNVPVGPGLIKASYAQVKGQFYDFTQTGRVEMSTPDPKVQKFSLGYVHNLSKRTALYATVGFTKNENGAAISPVNVASSDVSPGYTNTANSSAPGYRADMAKGYDIGIRHAF